MQVCAVVPTLIMALYRLDHGEQPIDPHPDLGYAANYLYMITGEVPDPDLARAVEQYQITTIDHGFNASTFTSRVITSTGADLAGGRRRRHRRPVRPAARRGAEPGARHARRHRHARQARPCGRRGRAAATGSWASATGSTRPTTRAPRAARASPSASAARWSTSPRRSSSTVVDVLAELKPGRELYANVEFYAGVVMDRLRPAPRPVHPDVRVQPGHRLVRQHPRAGRRQPDHPPVGPLRRPAAAAAGARRRRPSRRSRARRPP